MNKLILIVIWILTFSFALGQLGRIQVPDRPIYAYVYELVLFVLSLLLLSKYRWEPFKYLKKIKAYVILGFWMSVSLLISFYYYATEENVVAILYLLRLMGYMIFALYFAHHIRKYKVSLTHLFIVLSLSILGSSWLQYFLYPNIGNIAYLGWDPHLSRLVGPFLDPPITSALLFVSGAYLISYAKKRKNIFMISIVFMVTIPAVILTYSRGGLIATILAIGYLLFRIKKYVLILFLFLGSILFFIWVMPRSNLESLNLFRTTSIISRAEDYQAGFKTFVKHPIFGIGYNHIRAEKSASDTKVYKEDYNPSHGVTSYHSSFLTILVTTGVPGLVLFIWTLIGTLRKNLFFGIVMVFLVTISLFDNVLLHPFVLFVLILLHVEQS